MTFREVEVRSRERHGDHVLLSYGWDGPAPEPGQFVAVRPGGTGLDPFLPRPFFVHDYEDGILSLLFVVGGRGTALLARSDRLLVGPPRGRGFGLAEAAPVALLGGGVWAAPLRLLARRLAERGVEPEAYVEVPKDAHPDYARLLARRLPGAELVPTGGDDPQALLSAAGVPSRFRAVYVSGTAATLRAAREACAGSVPAQLAVRERMACTNGACYGCAVPVWRGGEKAYDRACVEGPVFGAGELAW
jgi:dihydroorotate dehydrogenase electron transfer subunit